MKITCRERKITYRLRATNNSLVRLPGGGSIWAEGGRNLCYAGEKKDLGYHFFDSPGRGVVYQTYRQACLARNALLAAGVPVDPEPLPFDELLGY